MPPLPAEVTVQETEELLQSGQIDLLLDCRQPAEHQIAHIEGAKLIPMGEISVRVEELRAHTDGRIVVYCHHGGRSEMVTNWLRAQGFTGAQNMLGGIEAWSVEIDSSVTRY